MRKLYHVKFLSPFHAGTMKGVLDETDSFIRSDTLTSAIIDCASKVFDNIDSFVESFCMSSVFYFKKDQKVYEYFIPKPKYLNYKGIEVKNLKKLKKLSFVPLKKLNQIMEGKFDNLPNNDFIVESNTVSATIDRFTNSAMPYSRTYITVPENYEGYFLVDLKDEKSFDNAISILNHEGIGGDRSSGFGKIHIYKPDIFPEDFLKTEGKKYLNLSLYKPKELELEKVNNNCYYSIIKRASWFKNGELTNRFSFFEEGSVFDFKPEGYNIKLDNPCPKIISGKSIFLGVS